MGYLCGVTIPEGVKMGTCKWPHKRITYYENMTFSGLSREEAKQTYDEAINLWAKVADIEPVRVDKAEDANIVANTGWLFFGIVGVSGIPCGASATSQMSQKFKSNTTWDKRSLREVMCHEIGHALGLPHLGRNSIMAAMAMGFNEPQPDDIREIQARYGAAKPKPQPDDKEKLALDGSGLFLIAEPNKRNFAYSMQVPKQADVRVEAITPLNHRLTVLKDSKVIGTSEKGTLTGNLIPGSYEVKLDIIDSYNGFILLSARIM